MKPVRSFLIAIIFTAAPFVTSSAPPPTAKDVYSFDDAPLEEPLEHPDWFKQSFLDLQEDLREAKAAEKRGIIVYFGQQRCAYCKRFMDVNFGLPDVVTYTQRHFDIIAIDIWGIEEVTDINGQVLTQRDFALREKTNFTPSFIFYSPEGEEALRLRGYLPPYQFRAALEYVADGHFQNEAFKDFLARGDDTLTFEPGDLNEENFFSPPPHMLDRSRFPGDRPLVVFFEQGDCHACDVLHGQPLREPTIHRMFQQLDSVQLDIWSDAPVVAPDGTRTTARKWADTLGLYYTPSILFFDEHGREIIRVDSVIRFYRLRNVLNFIVTRGYQSEPSYQRWRVSGGF